MREYTYHSDAPLSITLAADPRINSTDYINDQIWELTLNTGEPQALAVQTTFGLRATNMRVFPRFSIGHDESTNPARYVKRPTFNKIFPNFIQTTYSPFESLEVCSEYWVPSSHAIAGRIQLANISSQNLTVKIDLVGLLKPSGGGTRIIPAEIEGIPVLTGETEDLYPVIFITGGATSVNSPYTALVHRIDLPPGKSQHLIWCQASLNSHDLSFVAARDIASKNWDAEIARIELLNSSLVEIYTGDEDWDRALLLSQKNAYGLLQSSSDHLQHISYVTTRIPDDGYSLRENGSDYGTQWNGQTPLDTYYLSNLLLPASPTLVEGFLDNHLNSINRHGEIDWKPGLGGQMSNRLATPLLASLAWKIYQINEDITFLVSVFPRLINFLYSWFTEEHDRDQDGLPEWDHPAQAGFEDHPVFSRWNKWAEGVDITTAESPSLCAFLFRECQVLIKIAEILGDETQIENLERISKKLQKTVIEAWDDDSGNYTYWDRDNHTSTERAIYGTRHGSGTINIDRTFTEPERLTIQIISSQETTRKPQIIIHGNNATGKQRIEIIPQDSLLWFPGWATATSDQTYLAVESVEIKGLGKKDHVKVLNSGLYFEDITTLLPIWSGIQSPTDAQTLVKRNLLNPEKYDGTYGLTACPGNSLESDEGVCQRVYLPWCLLVAEGMLSYGYFQETAELVTKIMNGITKSMNAQGCFRQYLNASTGEGFGDIDALWGLAPLGLFLETLGLQILSSRKIQITGKNPFPWPVTVKFRGMTILRGLENTQIIFPDGQTIMVDKPEPCLVSLESHAI